MEPVGVRFSQCVRNWFSFRLGLFGRPEFCGIKGNGDVQIFDDAIFHRVFHVCVQSVKVSLQGLFVFLIIQDKFAVELVLCCWFEDQTERRQLFLQLCFFGLYCAGAVVHAEYSTYVMAAESAFDTEAHLAVKEVHAQVMFEPVIQVSQDGV